MYNVVSIDPAKRAFNDATSRFEAMQAHLHKIESDITLAIHVQRSLEENISVLKDRHTIPVLIEYGKAKEDLNKIYNNLTMLKINRNNLEHSLEEAKKYLEDCREKYLRSLEVQRSTVIEVDFGRKDDRQDGDST